MTKAFLQVVGSGSPDLPPSLYIFTDKRRFLINCGEGTQRFCMEHRVRLRKVNDILLTRISWDCFGGVPGMLLTLADAIGEPITLHGPPGLEQILRGTRHFLSLSKLNTTVAELPDTSEIDHEVMRTTAVLVQPTPTAGAASSAPPSPPASASPPASPADQSAKRARTAALASRGTLVYFFEFATPLGKFDAQRAKALGVPVGPNFGRLQRGHTVKLKDGRVVHPHEVLSARTPPPTLAVLDCPSADYLQPLLDAPAIGEVAGSKLVVAVVHMADAALCADPRYQQLLARFPADAQHIFVHRSHACAPTMFHSAAANQILLHQLDADVFPVPYFSAAPPQTKAVPTLLRYNLLPERERGLDHSECRSEPDVAQLAECAASILKHPNAQAALADLQKHQQEEEEEEGEDGRKKDEQGLAGMGAAPYKAAVVFLGTGSAIPSKYRNVSSILLSPQGIAGAGPDLDGSPMAAEHPHMLMDAGEGTYGQLFRRFGPAGLAAVLRNLAAVFISHLHADHHLGLINIILQRQRALAAAATSSAVTSSAATSSALVVVGPPMVRAWLAELEQRWPEPLDYHFVNCLDLMADRAAATTAADARLGQALQVLGLARLEAVPVVHCSQAYGAVVDHVDGWRLVYSGDTRPCPALNAAGRQATLVIHEATFENELAGEAELKRHSTIGEALACSAEMQAQHCVLTHFSQRYPKIPVFDDVPAAAVSAMAFDLMTVHLARLAGLPRLMPALRILFEQGALAAEAGAAPADADADDEPDVGAAAAGHGAGQRLGL